MRIGIDGSCLSNRRGFGRFARQALAALGRAGSEHAFAVLVDRPSLHMVSVPTTMETVAVEVREAPSRAASASGRRGVRDMLAMGKAAAAQKLDLIYFPASYSFFPVWNVGKVVTTLHDILALSRPELVFPTLAGRMAWAVKEHAAVRWSDRIVTVSQAARADLIAWFGLEPCRVNVVAEGPETIFRPMAAGATSDAVLRRYGLDPTRPFLLYVGGLSPHKNLVRMIEAFALAAPSAVDLILVGDLGDVFHTHEPALREAVGRCKLESRARFTGFVPDGDLVHLYSRARALMQPSLLEGFGLPAVEAMACGTPVLSSTAGSLPEVVGDAGMFFEPTDTGAMGSTIRTFFADPGHHQRLSRRALSQSSKFTWDATATGLLRIFESTAGPRRAGRAA